MRHDVLVSCGELAALISNAQPASRQLITLLDVRQGDSDREVRKQYESSHLPGAALVRLETMLAGHPGPAGRRPMPDGEAFAQAMRRLGVRNDQPIVVYDSEDGRAAARCWWLLKYFGHGSTRVLDGGLRQWTALQFPTQAGPQNCEPGDFVASAGHMPLLDAESASAIAIDGALIDARATHRYTGVEEPIDAKAGHIPEAINIPFDETMATSNDGSFSTDADLAATFSSLPSRDRVGVYCGSGTAAARQVLALQVVGIDASLYLGSWSNWISDDARPVEK